MPNSVILIWCVCAISLLMSALNEMCWLNRTLIGLSNCTILSRIHKHCTSLWNSYPAVGHFVTSLPSKFSSLQRWSYDYVNQIRYIFRGRVKILHGRMCFGYRSCSQTRLHTSVSLLLHYGRGLIRRTVISNLTIFWSTRTVSYMQLLIKDC